MKIGLPKEIKDNEYRVGLTPAGVQALADAGHELFVERSAGEGSGFSDEQYVERGRENSGNGGRGLADGRDDRQGQRTDRAGISANARRSIAFYISASRAGT